MELSWREIASFSLNWGILEEKTRDFRLNGGFTKRKRVIFTKMGGLREKMCFPLQWGIREEKTRDFRINVGFSKRKGVIFASMGDLRRENARFSG